MTIWSAEIKELSTLLDSISGQFPDLEKELVRLVKADDENMVLLYSRRCLEVIVTDLCEKELIRPRKTEPLKGIIDKLNKEEKVPSNIIASMQNLNSLSSFGAHPKEFDMEQVKPVLNNLATVIKWYLKYITPKTEGKTDEKQNARTDLSLETKSGKPVRNKYAIIVLGLLVISIAVIFALDLFGIFRMDRFKDIRDEDNRISIAVMPFQNLSGDTSYNVWQSGFQNLLISTLSNSNELAVRQYLTISSLLEQKKNVNQASITPAIARELALNLETRTFITGNILKAGNKIRLNTQLVNAETEEIYRTYQVEGNTEEDIFSMADSLSGMIRNYLELKKIIEEYESPEVNEAVYYNSAEAFQYYMYGWEAFEKMDLQTAIEWLSKAVEADTSFVNAYIFLSFTYIAGGNYNLSKLWCNKAYNINKDLPIRERLFLDHLHAYHYETPIEEIRICKKILEIDEMNTVYLNLLADAYYRLNQYKEAIYYWEKILDIHEKWETIFGIPYLYSWMGDALHKIGDHTREKEVYELGLNAHPKTTMIMQQQASCALSFGETVEAKAYIDNLISVGRSRNWDESRIAASMGLIYLNALLLDEAEKYYREALALDPANPDRLNGLAWLLIDNDIDINEGVALAERSLEIVPDDPLVLDTWGWGLYKQRRYERALEILNRSWELRVTYTSTVYQHLKAAEQAAANQNSEQ